MAEALALPVLDRAAVARRLAELGELPGPTREETVDYLVDALVRAVSNIPSRPVAWSWGEFHNGGGEALEAIGREQDWYRLAVCAVDLGLDGEQPPSLGGDEWLTPRQALTRNLRRATEQVMQAVERRLTAAGISPYGHPGLPRRRQPDT